MLCRNHGRLGAALAGAGLLLVSLLAAPVTAQDALGAGDALDANTNAREGRGNRAARQPDFRSRNRIVTGNVAGGREFRGDVGYLAPDDFLGRLGSNDLFRFRADSAYSSPAIASVSRSYDALRYGFEAGAVGYDRSGSAATPETLGESQQWYLPADDVTRRIVVDRMTLARSLAVRAETEAEAELVGTTTGREGQPLLVTASPVRGIVTVPQEEDLSLLGLSSFDRARLLEDREETEEAPAPGARFDARVSTVLADDVRVSTGLDDTRIDPRTQTDYERILQRIADRYADREDVDLQVQPDLLENLDAELEQLREQLRERPDASDAGAGEEAEEDTADTGTEQAPPRDVVPPPSRAEDLGVILRHGARIEQLTTDGKTRFDELVASGEDRLRAGEYFWAERRFERALRFVPGHPLATVGLGHAQIGAGVYLPAAMTLRSLLLLRPEMIDARYDEGLLPNRVQLNKAIGELDARLAGGPDDQDAGLYGFLMAYIGHQIGDRPLVDRGFALMARSEENETLVGLLDRVWRAEVAPEK